MIFFWNTVSSAVYTFFGFFLFFPSLSTQRKVKTLKWKRFGGLQPFLWLAILNCMTVWEAKHWKYLACSYLWVLLKYSFSQQVGKFRRPFYVWKSKLHHHLAEVSCRNPRANVKAYITSEIRVRKKYSGALVGGNPECFHSYIDHIKL